MSRRGRLLAIALVAVPAISCGTAQAQEVGEPADRAAAVTSHAEISASTDDSTASIVLELGGRRLSNRIEGEINYWRYNQTSLTISTPFDGKKDASPATLDGLANGTKATLRFGSFSGASRSTIAPEMEKIVGEALARCHEVEASPTARKECDDASTQGRQLWLIQKYLPGRARSALRAQVPASTLDWGIEGSVGYQEFEFVTPATLAQNNSRKVEFGAKAFFAWYPVSAPLAITGSVAYQRGFEAQDEAVLCPAGNGTTVTCVKAAPGAPALDENLLLAGGLRFRLGGGAGKLPPFAVAPLVTYDAIDKIFGVDVPFYLLANKDGGLIGGVRAGWRSDDKKLRFGVFIGSAFNIFQ